MKTTAAATAAVLIGTRLAAHHIADRWFQTSRQACGKGRTGIRLVWLSNGTTADLPRPHDRDVEVSESTFGLSCLAGHVASYTATELVATIAVARMFRLPVTATGIATGQAISTVTHALIDHRPNHRRIAAAPLLVARHMKPRSPWRLRITALSQAGYLRRGGQEPCDQALHTAFVTAGAIVTGLLAKQ